MLMRAHKDEGAGARDANPLKQHIQPLDSAGAVNVVKQFFTLRAQLALNGYCLSRTDGGDGPVSFHVSRCDTVRQLRDLAAVEGFLDQVGAAHA
jgi:hypothetical protein